MSPREPGCVFTEHDWSNLDGVMRRYSRGQTLAERAAWDYVADLPADRHLELAHRAGTRPESGGLRRWFDPSVRLLVDDLGRELRVSSDKARRVLGWRPRGLLEMVRDTARAVTERRRAGRGQPAVTR